MDYRRLVSPSHFSIASANSAKRMKPSRCPLPHTISIAPSLFRRILGSSHSGEPLRIRLSAAGGVYPRHGEAQGRVSSIPAVGDRVVALYAVCLRRYFNPQQLLPPLPTSNSAPPPMTFTTWRADLCIHPRPVWRTQSLPLHPLCALGDGLVQRC